MIQSAKRTFVSAVVIAVFAVAQSASAALFTWNGSTALWNSPNWLPGNVAGPTGGNANSADISSGTVTFHANDIFGNHATASTVIVTLNAGGTLASGSRFNAMIDVNFNGGTLLANGGVNSPFGAFALKGTIDVAGAVPSNINVGGGSNNTVSVGAGGGGGVTTFNVADVTGNATSDFNVNAIINNLGGTPSAFTKTGLGTMTLTAANTFSGTTTTVSAGTLNLNNTAGSGLGASNASVLAGGTLGGTGAFTGTASIATGGTLAPGGVAVIESLGTGNLTFANNAIYSWEYQGALADLTNVTGTLGFGAGLTVLITSLDGGALASSPYTLFSYTGADPVAPAFNVVFGANTPTGAVNISVDGLNKRVLLTAIVVPEPASLSLLVIGGAALLRRRRAA